MTMNSNRISVASGILDTDPRIPILFFVRKV